MQRHAGPHTLGMVLCDVSRRIKREKRARTFLYEHQLIGDFSYRFWPSICSRMQIFTKSYEYEAGRLYGTTEVIRQCTEHEAPLNLF